MNLRSLIFAAGGIVAGLVIGFFVTNSLNKTASLQSQRNVELNAVANKPVSAESKAIDPAIEKALAQASSAPGNYALQLAAGDLSLKVGRYKEALTFYQAAQRLRPNEYEVIVKVGNGFFESGNFSEAQKSYERALEMKPNDVGVRTDYGLTFFMQEPPDIDRAIDEFNRSLKQEPNHAIALQNLAIAFKSKGDVESMNKTLARLEKIEPANPLIKRFREDNSAKQ